MAAPPQCTESKENETSGSWSRDLLQSHLQLAQCFLQEIISPAWSHFWETSLLPRSEAEMQRTEVRRVLLGCPG